MYYLTKSLYARLVAAGVVSTSSLLLFVVPAFAQETTLPTPLLPTASQLSVFILMALVFAILALGIVFLYLYRIQEKFYTATENLSRTGKAVKVIASEPFSRGDGLESVTGAGKGTPARLIVDGPGVVTVGAESEPFTVVLEPDDPTATITWSVAPANVAVMAPATGRQVRIFAAVAGVFTLTATVEGGGSAALQIAAIASQNIATELPFIGRGYGSIAIAIILLTTVIILGLAGVLSGEGASTLLGGLLGYIFGIGVSSARNQSEGGQRGE